MASYLDYSIFSIKVQNSANEIAEAECTSYENILSNPFPTIGEKNRVFYKNDVQKWEKQLLAFTQVDVTETFESVLSDAIEVDAVYQEISQPGASFFCRYHWTKTRGMYRTDIDIKASHAEKLAVSAPFVDEELWMFSDQMIECSLATADCELGCGRFRRIEEEKSNQEKQLSAEQAWLETFRPYFDEISSIDIAGKRFVIAEKDYSSSTKSRGKQISAKLLALGGKETKDLSAKTNYLFVSTTNISGLYEWQEKQTAIQHGQKDLASLFGRSKIEKAIEMKKAGIEIKIVTLECIEKYI